MMQYNTIELCDCLEYMRNIEKNGVDCICTDIPYNEVNRKSNGLQCHGYTIRFDHGNADGAQIDLNAVLDEMWRVCRGSFYIFCGLGQISQINSFFRDKKTGTRLIVWEKTNPLPINGEHIWLSGIETCVFAKKSGATYNYRCRNTVLRYPIAKNEGHPTTKPVNLMRELIRASTNENDIVLDTFLGSGTTAVAAIQEKRRFLGCEIEKKYFDIAKARIDKELSQSLLF